MQESSKSKNGCPAWALVDQMAYLSEEVLPASWPIHALTAPAEACTRDHRLAAA